MQQQISIIIPAYNEEDYIAYLIDYLKINDVAGAIAEIIVSDGGSVDKTVRLAIQAGAKVVRSTEKGRAIQMNYGASFSIARFLYFLHADTVPPKDYAQRISEAIKKGYESGCFRLKFDHEHWFLNANSWFTRFDVNLFRFGDQSLFVSKKVFEQTVGFNERLTLLEDHEIIPRIKKNGRFIVMNQSVNTSARKYVLNGIYKTQVVYYFIYMMYKLRFSQKKLISTYRFFINQNKI